ncbi:TorD/DmsD family molecular chaperone [Pseudosulfitobacter pseudonitzschiae]|uniref:TorD/DmsD family molecular chaperone n=1 Tax=Pseudosulfitobacter pseudonitzschiae TaxID=1402135 RepID=UPI001CCE6150|nr:molecular chaperone TorD family protein [Pseudosulfitobacter pseudonitzschiae]MCA0137178.1 molecular chaperone TorD family protein [Pseudosulfitobacter pseudonitzschiae]MCD2328950.1 molecular chaperone TorD family protein [Pseudosulfitobacter pseudonitzschiae]MCD2353190.1 molecular chaperone TorD family protein [Pseudosulfitobacter pseudonitzschiae]MCI2217374.1 molecular chaperone TorD family protein [Pseudosulfitobacter pseudonitzschiae]UFE31508.1 molecular chaperone TorD family protein [P
MNQMTGTQIPEEDRLRADLYNFMGLILSAPPDRMLLDQCAGLNGDDTELGQGIATLAKLARLTKPATVEAEFNRLFIGLGRGELLPYASYYLTGFLNEKPLALLRQDMAARGLARADTVFEPEDNIASLMEMMGAMIAGRFGTPATLDQQKTFFGKHIAPWAGHFFSDLEGAKTSVFYAPVGKIGRAFMEVESEAFRLSGT